MCPKKLAQRVVMGYHEQGHPGVPKLISLLGRRYIFSLTSKQLYDLCWQVCHHCQDCQAVKPRKGSVPGTMDFCPIPPDIFQSVCMDFVDLDPSNSQRNLLIVALWSFVDSVDILLQYLVAKVA